MKLLVDMNLSPRWKRFLADAGIEAAHWSDLGASNAPDAEIMAFAKAHDYVVLTHDLDFSAILAATHGEKPSVVQVRSGTSARKPWARPSSAQFARRPPIWTEARCSPWNRTACAYGCCRFNQGSLSRVDRIG